MPWAGFEPTIPATNRPGPTPQTARPLWPALCILIACKIQVYRITWIQLTSTDIDECEFRKFSSLKKRFACLYLYLSLYWTCPSSLAYIGLCLNVIESYLQYQIGLQWKSVICLKLLALWDTWIHWTKDSLFSLHIVVVLKDLLDSEVELIYLWASVCKFQGTMQFRATLK
jgi:hypothetical protein